MPMRMPNGSYAIPRGFKPTAYSAEDLENEYEILLAGYGYNPEDAGNLGMYAPQGTPIADNEWAAETLIDDGNGNLQNYSWHELNGRGVVGADLDNMYSTEDHPLLDAVKNIHPTKIQAISHSPKRGMAQLKSMGLGGDYKTDKSRVAASVIRGGLLGSLAGATINPLASIPGAVAGAAFGGASSNYKQKANYVINKARAVVTASNIHQDNQAFLNQYKEANHYFPTLEKVAFEKLAYDKQKEQELIQENARANMKGMASNVGALGMTGTGLGVAGYAHNKGMMDGRRKLYHNTELKNVPGILEKGILGSKTNDTNSFTRKIVEGSGISDYSPFENKAYLAKTRLGAEMAHAGRYTTNSGVTYSDIGKLKDRLLNSKTLTASIPLEDYKGIKQVANPELRGAKSPTQFLNKLKTGFMEPSLAEKADVALQHYNLGKGTAVVDGDLPAKYIKGGKGYAKNSLGQVAKHVKAHPGMAALGAAGLVGGGTLATLGAKQYIQNTKDTLARNKAYQAQMKDLKKS